MDAIFPKPTIFAHRGSSVDAPENTLSAFELAIQQGAHAIELDIQLSADGHVVVIHDHRVDRTTNGSGQVGKMELRALKELDAGSYRSEKFKGERIPTLSEVLETVGEKILINIEIKNYATPLDDLPVRAANLVKKHSMQNRVLFSSFNPLALRAVKKKLPNTPCGFLIASGSWNALWRFIGRSILEYNALHPSASVTTQELVQKVHKEKKRIHVYTVNDPVEMQKLLSMGVDGIFTDRPKLALQVLKELK